MDYLSEDLIRHAIHFIQVLLIKKECKCVVTPYRFGTSKWASRPACGRLEWNALRRSVKATRIYTAPRLRVVGHPMRRLAHRLRLHGTDSLHSLGSVTEDEEQQCCGSAWPGLLTNFAWE